MPQTAAGGLTPVGAMPLVAPPRLLIWATSPARRSPTTRLNPLYSCAAQVKQLPSRVSVLG